MHLGADEILAIADDARNDCRDIEIVSGRKLRQFDHGHAKGVGHLVGPHICSRLRGRSCRLGARRTNTNIEGGLTIRGNRNDGWNTLTITRRRPKVGAR
jgi:hypothetical protein